MVIYSIKVMVYKILMSFERLMKNRKLTKVKNSWKNAISRRIDNESILSDTQKREISDYYSCFDKICKIDNVCHSFYYEKTGRFDVRYIPDDIYYTLIDPYYNDWDKAQIIDNKCFYERMFVNINQPKTIFSRMNGFWLDSNRNMVSFEKVCEIVNTYEEIVVKEAAGSYGGKGVCFLSGNSICDSLKDICKDINNDIVIQEVIKQHSVMSSINPSSINTIRVLSMLNNDGVKIYSSVLRMGIDGSRVDNASSGGITCGINPDGTLKNVAYSAKGEKYSTHPTSDIEFNLIKIPSFDKVIQFVEKLHPFVPSFRLVSWDVAIDINGQPVLIEANLYGGELDFHQLNNGPVFGGDTERILKEVVDDCLSKKIKLK